MHNINANKTGLVFGAVLGGIHLVWAILVAIGVAQWLMDFIFNLHMINPIMVVGSFSLGLAIGLIVVTAIIGYVIGYVFGMVWNRLHR